VTGYVRKAVFFCDCERGQHTSFQAMVRCYNKRGGKKPVSTKVAPAAKMDDTKPGSK